MDKQQTPPARKEYLVWADYRRRMCQYVEAKNPQEAHRIANERTDDWVPCDTLDPKHYRLSGEVMEVETEEYIRVEGSGRCRTCSCEIVDDINESYFRDGECGLCEYARYVSHRKLVPAAYAAYGAICDLSYHPCFRWNKRRFEQANKASEELTSALNEYGKDQ